MAVKQEFLDFLSDQLTEFGPVEIKRMFGGVGIFKNGKMFGMIGSDHIFRLKVDEVNQSDYEATGMKPLYISSKKRGMPYWEVPAGVIEDPQELAIWAKKAFEAALRN